MTLTVAYLHESDVLVQYKKTPNKTVSWLSNLIDRIVRSDDVTRFQDENTSCVRGTVVAFSRPRGSKHGHGFAVDINIDPSSAVIVGLQVNIVPSSGRHSQFSILVLHAACKMDVRGTDRPVFNHYGVKMKKIDVNSG